MTTVLAIDIVGVVLMDALSRSGRQVSQHVAVLLQEGSEKE